MQGGIVVKQYFLVLPLLIILATIGQGPCPGLELTQYDLVSRVIDGDTIELDSGEIVRYIGVDAPETVHPWKPIGCYGPEAAEFNKKLVGVEYVHLEYDVDRVDWYGRTLAYVYLQDATFVNGELIRQGYARAVSYAPNTKHSPFLMDLQREAMADERGLWGDCYEEVPNVDLRPPPSCPYIASVHQEVFHFQTCFYVDRIKEENKRCFENTQAAIESGRRPCKRCLVGMQEED